MLCDYFRLNYVHINIAYYTIDALACSYCNTATADYTLLQEKLELAYYDNAFPFKHIIIDEGQDFGQDRIEEADIINLLETIALSEEVGGSFYLFYDKNQLVQGSRIPKYISDSECKLTLYKNCRNTENIAITSMRPLGIDSKPKMFKGCVKGESPKILITDSLQKQKDFLDSSIKQLVDKKIKDIVILSCATEEQSAFSQYCINGHYACNGSRYKFTTCRKFKGLEADAIIIVDITKKTLDSSNLNFYVGASRARFSLSVVCQMSDEDCIEALKHFDTATAKKPKKALAAALNSMLIF
jgi:DNA helicase IV